jgi:hypothetical protein
MGMALGTQNDLDTIAALSAAFTTHQLVKLRKVKEPSGKLFDRFHTLSRLAFRLEAFPPQVPLKWFALLDHITATTPTVAQNILSTLQQALAPGIQSVTFAVRPTSGGAYDVRIDTSTQIFSITLLCPGDWTGSNLSFPPADHGEGAPTPTAPLDLGPHGPDIN